MKNEGVRITHPEEAFSTKGFFSTTPGFEFRPSQVKMASLVWETFTKGGVALIEAGTGTGKSLAYLYPGFFSPLMHTSPAQSEEMDTSLQEQTGRTIIATHTINLQQQLIEKDIPYLAGVTNYPLKAALLMGRSNYLCRRKMMLLETDQDRLRPEERRTLMKIMSSAEKGDGCLEKMGVALSTDLKTMLISETETCLRGHCPFLQTCFWHSARKRAFDAQVVVVNHHLFFADLALRKENEFAQEKMVLPPYEYVVFDEAHHLEEVATLYLGIRLAESDLEKFFTRLLRKDGRWSGGHLTSLRRRLLEKSSDLPFLQRNLYLLEAELIPGLNILEKSWQRLYALLKAYLSQNLPRTEEANLRFTTDLPAEEARLAEVVTEICESTAQWEKKVSLLADEWQELEELQEDSVFLLEAGRYLHKLRSDLPIALNGTEEKYVHWLEVKEQGEAMRLAVNRLPLYVGDLLYKSLFSKVKSVVCTSATLAVGKRFEYIKAHLGIDLVHPSERRESILEPPFDYERQVLVMVAKDLPFPDSPQFLQEVIAALPKIMEAAGGRSLLLFTNHQQMKEAYQKTAPFLKSKGYSLFIQGEMPRHRLLKKFKSSPSPVLFGTDSFWEGVDVPGAQLSTLLIMRLPFRVPTEPLFQAKSEALAKEGKESFFYLSLPEAVIKFKQGFGRLIRTKKDRGVVIILDKRILTKAYGRIFLSSVPGGQVLPVDVVDIPEKIESWLG